MNATMLTNRVAEKINNTIGREVVIACQVPKSKFDGYFVNGVALQVDGDVDDFNQIMRMFSGCTIEVGATSAYIEPYNMTYIAVWED
jgi:hypothetical protein